MGCSESTADNIHNPRSFPTNPHKYPQNGNNEGSSDPSQTNSILKSLLLTNKSQNQNSSSSYYAEFQNSYDYIWDLYERCSGNLQQFFYKLQEEVSIIYMTISKSTLDQMNQNSLINNQSKIQISEEILAFNLNILKVIGKKTNHKFDQTIFKQVNKLQKNLVGYLKMKYPRGAQTFVPGDLMKVFKEFDISDNVEFDILRNSNTYFGDQSDENLSKSIKIFLNSLIDQLDYHYPLFQKMMQQQVFCVKYQNNQIKTLNYKIGRKIPENVTKYVQLDSNNLQINSPQIFRVLIKWMTDLQEILLNPSEKINTKKNFKCFIEIDEKGNKIFDEINEDQYYDLINYELIQKIDSQKNAYEDNMKVLLNDMDRFNFNLIKLLDISVRKQKYVPVRQMEIIKYANLNAKFISWILAQKLMLVMKKLIKIGKSFYDGKNMVTLDLINFKVSDLMRCQVSGNKKQILEVYNNLKKLEVDGQIKIIKIKNRLATSLNDAMIIFSMKNTSLICQIQLLLADSSQKINQKYKNIQVLNHFFYELERSPYGILSQIAVLLAYKDSKVSYQDNISFLPNEIKIDTCQKQHPDKVTQKKIQLKPFICTKCTNYYQKLQNLFLMKQCQLCNTFICGKCLIAGNSTFQLHILNKAMSEVLQKKINKTLSLLRNFQKSVRAMDILGLFPSRLQKIVDVFGSNQVTVGKFTQLLSRKTAQSQIDLSFFVIVKFRTGKADFRLLGYKHKSKQIYNPFNQKNVFVDKAKMKFTSYDLILFFKKQLKSQTVNEFSDSLLYIFENEAFLRKNLKDQSISCLRLQDLKIPIQFIQKKNNNDAQQGLVILKTFPEQTLNQYVSALPDLQGAKSILKFNDLGLFSKHLNYFKQIDWANQIKQLKLGKNNINDISVILSCCNNLQKLYVNGNHLKSITFLKSLNELQILNCSQNILQKLQNIKFIKNIDKLLANKNKIKKFEKNSFQNLKILNLSNNWLQSINEICQSTIPNLQQLNLQQSSQNGGSTYQKQLIFDFPKLKSLISTNQCEGIQITSTKLQRLSYTDSQLTYINIKSTQNLRFVTLYGNSLTKINFLFPDNLNNTNNVIAQIDASRNQINSIPIMRSKSLKQLNLYQNAITNIDNFANSALSEIASIDFNYNSLTSLCQFHFKSLTNLNVAHNPLHSLNELQSSTLDSLKELKISQTQTISTFPKLSFKSLTNLQIISVSFENLQNLTKCNFPQIQILTLKSCKFKSFPLLQFKNLTNLDLQSSEIGNLKNLQQSSLQNLQTLNLTQVFVQQQQLQNNPIADEVHQQVISKQTIFTCKLNFPKLKLLSMNYSNIKLLDGLQNSKLQKIETISITGMNLTRYPLLNLSNLKIINAESCNISNFQQLMNPQLINIQEINLTYNNIGNVTSLNFPKLKRLLLGTNKMKQFIQSGQIPFMQSLYLSNNQLEQFPIIKGPKIKVLQTLTNKFKSIDNLQFCQLPKLQNLQIQNYQFGERPFPKISMQSLKSLYFKSNQIKDISNFQFCNLPLVEDINFSLNAIQIIPRLKFPNLKYLRLNKNSIKDVSRLSESEMPELQFIEVQQNKIEILPYLPFPNLTKIFMHKNDVLDVSGFNESPIKNFLILNICENKNLKDFPLLKNTFEELYANDTSLTDASIINNYKNLKKLQINRNKILSVPAFKQKLLVMIQIQGNLISDLSQFASEQYPFVTEFSVKQNPLKILPKLRMPSLLNGFFNECQFQDLSQFSKSQLPKLDMLSLENNKIAHIKSLPFPNMKSIYLSKNPLQQLVCFTLPQYNRLQMLVCATTSIKNVQILPKMPKLSKVWFNSSKIEDIKWLAKSESHLPKLNTIIFLDNLVKELPDLSGFSCITQINLVNNPISKVDQFTKTKGWDAKSMSLSLDISGDKQFAEAQQKITKVCPYAYVSRYYHK